MVEDVGGKITVESEVGRGTKIKIALAARFLQEASPDCPNPDPGSIVPENVRLGFVTSSSRTEQARRDRRIRSVVSKTCTEWIGCTYEDVRGLPEASKADVCLMIESDFEQWSDAKRLRGEMTTTDGEAGSYRRAGPPIIVLSALVDTAARRMAADEQANIIFMNQPFGPRKLSRTIKAALEGSDSATLRSPTKRKAQTPEPRPRVAPASRHSRSFSDQLPGASQGHAEQQEEEKTAPSSPNPSTGKILLVEDNTVNMKVSRTTPM